MSLLQKLNSYKQSEKEIFEYFGFENQHNSCSIQDNTKMFWTINNNRIYTKDENGNMYDYNIEKVYEKEFYTAVLYTNLTDDEFIIFDNLKQKCLT